MEIDFTAVSAGVVATGRKGRGVKIAGDSEVTVEGEHTDTMSGDTVLIWDTCYWNGKRIEVGDRLKITGERGDFEFVQYAKNTESGAEWIDTFSVTKRYRRSFKPSAIKAAKNVRRA